MLILSESDILRSIDFKDLLISVEKALLLQEDGDFYMPDRIHLDHGPNTQLLMPAFSGDYFCTKLVSVYPGNKEIELPSVSGTVILQDAKTGETLALLNGSVLTALRTGAVGALGLAYTAPRGIETIGLVGAGVQGFHQALFAGTVRNIKKIGIFDPNQKAITSFINRLKDSLPGTRVIAYNSVHALVNDSEAVITATTSATPVIPDDKKLLKGKHFIGIGSYKPSMREYPDALFQLTDRVIIDTPMAMRESGDLLLPLQKGWISEEQVFTLGKLIRGTIRPDDSDTSFFKSVGMALFDLTAATAIYNNSRAKGIGREVTL